MRRLYAMSFFILLIACTSSEKASTSKTNQPNLRQDEAQMRRAQVDGVHYQIQMDLTQAAEFSGTTNIDFNWKPNSGKDLRIDFYQAEMTSAILNGKSLEIKYNGVFLLVPKQNLLAGLNHLVLSYRHPYATDGMGLTRFVDPIDQRPYLHTKFEPYYANRMFPCFDQPDIKASYEIRVKAPKDWVVTSAMMENSVVPTEDGNSLWTFPESQAFSTYLFSIHAGPYKVWSDHTTEIPMRLLARQSLAKYVNSQDWFLFAKQGFAFYNSYFGYAYPFEKYDQVIAPAFSSGAMENVADVTFTERLISRGKPSRTERRGLANIILHEMAHMWFGDLVTMKWWNDLWLNESFATYMSSLAMVSNTEFKEAWMPFNSQKSWSMWEDQLVTTHPVESPVHDALEALTAFDGITYGKGASVLQQVHFFLGPQQFQKGVQQYFQKFAWSNTERKDFMASLAAGSGKNLDEWQRLWLTTSNLNTIEPSFTCSGGKLSQLLVKQTAPTSSNYLRPHAFTIGLLQNKNTKLKLFQEIRAEFPPQSAVLDLSSQVTTVNCPDALYPNLDDHGYFNVKLDPVSLEFFLNHADSIEDTFLRKLVWTSLGQMVRDAQLSFIKFGDLAARALANEKDESISELLSSSLVGGRGGGVNVLNYYYQADLDKTDQFHKFVTELEKLFAERLLIADQQSQKTWVAALINASEDQNGLNQLQQILDGKAPIFARIPIDQDLRWAMIRHLAVHATSGIEDRIAAEYKADPSFNGRLGSIAAEASLPKWDEKQKWISELKNVKPNYTYAEFSTAVGSLFPSNQKNLRAQYSPDFFKDLVAIQNFKQSEEQSLYANLAPSSCQPDSTREVQSFLEQTKNLDPGVRKRLAQIADANFRCYKAVSFSLSNPLVK